MSPMAKMCGTLVRICLSTAMKPRSVDGDAGLLGADQLAVRRAADGDQHQVVALRSSARPRLRSVTSMPSRLRFDRDRLRLQHDVVEARRVHLLPHLDEIAVGARHQAVEHLDDVEARAERRIDRRHLEADDAAADDEHAASGSVRSSSAPVESTMRGSSGMNGSFTASEPAGDDGVLEARRSSSPAVRRCDARGDADRGTCRCRARP